MLEKLFNHPYALHQTADGDDIPNATILGYVDNGGCVIVSQEGRCICIDRGSVPDLIKLLKSLRASK